MPDTSISGLSSADPASTALVPLVVNTTTVKTTLDEAVGFWSTAQGDMVYAAAARNLARLAPPTTGAVMVYSSGSSAPSWSIPTSGAVMVGTSLGVPAWRAIGSSGQVLQSTGGTPTWVSGRWGVTANFPNAASSQIVTFRVPFDCLIDEWDMVLSSGPTSAVGSATVEVRVDARSSTPASSVAQISSGSLPTVSNATNNGSSAISSWTSTSLTEDTWVTLYLATVSSADGVAFSMGGRKS